MNKFVSFDGIGYVAATFAVDEVTKTILSENFTNPKTGNVDVNHERLAVKLNSDGTVGFGEESGSEGVKGVYTLTISTMGIVDDKIEIGDTELTFIANDDTPEGNEINVGATPSSSEQAANIVTFLNGQSSGLKDTFTITNDSNTIIFTQKVEGTGEMPTVTATKTTDGTIEAAIVTTTEGEPAVEPAYSADDTLFGVMIAYEMDGFATIQTAGYVEGVPTATAIDAGVKSLVVNNRGKIASVDGIKNNCEIIVPSTNSNLNSTILIK